MDIIAKSASASNAKPAHDSLRCESGFVKSSEVYTLDIETVASNPLLPTKSKWGIRFDPTGTVTLILGMRDYGRGRYTAYFAGLLAGRLGLSFHRVLVYYSAIRPAVLQMPQPSGIQLPDSDPPPVVRAVRDLIEDMCGRVTEKGRLAFAANAGVAAADVGFDQQSGRFFVVDRGHNSRILEIAAANLRRARRRSLPSSSITSNAQSTAAWIVLRFDR
jgi:CO/xanthine dehydrogenase Mo-binding subunit